MISNTEYYRCSYSGGGTGDVCAYTRRSGTCFDSCYGCSYNTTIKWETVYDQNIYQYEYEVEIDSDVYDKEQKRIASIIATKASWIFVKKTKAIQIRKPYLKFAGKGCRYFFI